MNNKPTHAISIEGVEALLRSRRLEVPSDHHEEIESLAMAISGLADDETRKRVDRHLAECPACREILLLFHQTTEESQRSTGDNIVSLNEKREQRKRLWRPISLSAAALLLGAVSLFLLTETKLSTPTEDRFVTKGHRDGFTVAVRRGQKAFTAKHLEELKTGDNLGFFYSASTPGYLAVLNRDTSGKTAVLFPGEGVNSQAIEAGETISLPDGAVVEEGTACEWVIAVFSENPIPLELITSAAQNAKKTRTQCGLSLDLKEARTISVLPFLR
jgi:hypothetical protein